jgi:hypothetical protein
MGVGRREGWAPGWMEMTAAAVSRLEDRRPVS